MGRTAYTEPQCLYKDDLYLYLYMSHLENTAANSTIIRSNSTIIRSNSTIIRSNSIIIRSNSTIIRSNRTIIRSNTSGF